MSYFKNCFGRKIAYTEDDIVVRKLFLKCPAGEVKIDELRKHFDGYGTVRELQLNDKSDDNTETTGFVLYQCCRDAADALAKDVQIVNECRVAVQAYFSWGQPEIESIEQIEPADHSITRLNDDCLERVYRYLPLADQLNLARLCKRCPPLYKSINLCMFTSMSAWNVRDFFIYFGPYLLEIYGDIPYKNRQLLVHFLGKHCSDLRVLRISQGAFAVPNMYKLFQQQLLQLEELQLQSFCLEDESLPALRLLRNLRKLNLCYNQLLTGKHMDCLPSSIESLNLLYCNALQFELLPGICKSLPRLRELSLRLNQTGNGDVFRQLACDRCCECLESLTISTGSFDSALPSMQYLAKLPSLSKLILDGSPSDLLLEWLVEHKRQQLVHFEVNQSMRQPGVLLPRICQLEALRVLSLPAQCVIDDLIMEQLGNLRHLEHISLQQCSKVSDYAVQRLLLDCDKLHTLRLIHCRLLGNKLIHNIISQLTEEVLLLEQRQRQLPVKLQLFGSKIHVSMLQHPAVTRKDMVEVTLLRSLQTP